MYQVFLLVLVLISFSLICDDNSGLEFLMVLKCFKTGLILPSFINIKFDLKLLFLKLFSPGKQNFHIKSQGEDGTEILQPDSLAQVLLHHDSFMPKLAKYISKCTLYEVVVLLQNYNPLTVPKKSLLSQGD